MTRPADVARGGCRHGRSRGSPLWNPDLAPTPPERRTWSTYNIAALWIGMSVVITTYTLASGLMQQGMNWWQAMVTILLGNTIVLVPMVLNAHAGTKYGISFPVLCRASFGVRGANLPAILRAIVACGWFGIQTWIGGAGARRALPARRGRAGPRCPARTAIAFAIFWLIQVAVILKGTEGIKLLESWSAPLLLGGGALLLVVGHHGAAAGSATCSASRSSCRAGPRPFWALFPAALTASVGYWATLSLNIPDFTRYARSQRSQVLGQALGLPTTMTAFAFIGVAVTSATIVIFGEPIWDPVVLVGRIGGAGVIVFAALVVLAAQLTTNMAANVVSPSNDFSNLSPRRISYVTGGLITAVIGILDDAVEALLRRGRLHLHLAARLLEPDGRAGRHPDRRLLGPAAAAARRRRPVPRAGRYTYRGGVNPRAVAAFVLAILPVVPGFVRAVATPGGTVADPNLFDRLYSYAWFVTFALSFVAVSRAHARTHRVGLRRADRLQVLPEPH